MSYKKSFNDVSRQINEEPNACVNYKDRYMVILRWPLRTLGKCMPGYVDNEGLFIDSGLGP